MHQCIFQHFDLTVDAHEGHIKAHFGGEKGDWFWPIVQMWFDKFAVAVFSSGPVRLWRGIGFFDFIENQCVPICEDEIYFTDLAAPTMGQYFTGMGRITGNNRVLDRETRQVIFFSFKCLFLHSLNLPFALL